jgi:hypothetical protein
MAQKRTNVCNVLLTMPACFGEDDSNRRTGTIIAVAAALASTVSAGEIQAGSQQATGQMAILTKRTRTKKRL